jgi:hypothetical protein
VFDEEEEEVEEETYSCSWPIHLNSNRPDWRHTKAHMAYGSVEVSRREPHVPLSLIPLTFNSNIF